MVAKSFPVQLHEMWTWPDCLDHSYERRRLKLRSHHSWRKHLASGEEQGCEAQKLVPRFQLLLHQVRPSYPLFSFFFAFLAVGNGEMLSEKRGAAASWRGRSPASGKKKREPRALETQPKTTSFWGSFFFFLNQNTPK